MEEQHLPKVEELLDKDYEMMEVPITKQPLKSILNKPLPKPQPTSILKKPKSKIYQEAKEPYHNSEGRRRQRASSESDNLYYSFNYGSASGCDSRISNIKRPKDMLNVGYSYGSAIANINPAPVNCPKKLNQVKEHHSTYPTLCKEEQNRNLHVLGSTTFKNNAAEEESNAAVVARNNLTQDGAQYKHCIEGEVRLEVVIGQLSAILGQVIPRDLYLFRVIFEVHV